MFYSNVLFLHTPLSRGLFRSTASSPKFFHTWRFLVPKVESYLEGYMCEISCATSVYLTIQGAKFYDTYYMYFSIVLNYGKTETQYSIGIAFGSYSISSIIYTVQARYYMMWPEKTITIDILSYWYHVKV